MKNVLRLVFWELTARCNLKCRHCRAEATPEAIKGELTTDEIISTAKDIRAVADPIIILTGGEPLSRPDFFDIAKGCCGLFSRVALATNGTMVDEAVAKKIADTGIQRVSVSLDGANAKTHDDFRGLKGSFDDTIKGFKAMREAGVSMQINTTVATHNVDQLPDILNLAIELGADAFHVFVLVPVGCGAELSDDIRLPPDRMEQTLRWLFDKSQELKDRMHLKATCAPQYYRIMREVAAERKIEIQHHGHGMQAMTRGCLAGSAVCFLSRIGDIQPCGYLPVIVGNVRKRKFADIWNDSEEFKALRDPARLKGKCHSCGYRVVCEGCRARAYAETNDFLAEDPSCSFKP